MTAKIRQNDDVIILTGKDKGKRGKVKDILPFNKVLVEGINLIKKHQKPSPTLKKAGGIIERETTIQISNIAIFNKITKKPDRVGFRFENGKKVRFLKSNNKTIK